MTREQFDRYTIGELRSLLARLGGAPCNKKKSDLIDEIVSIRDGTMKPARSNRGRPTVRSKRTTVDFLTMEDIGISTFRDIAGDVMKVEGILEKGEGGGYLRRSTYAIVKSDVFVSQDFIDANYLVFGDSIVGECVQEESDKPATLRAVFSINGKEPRTAPVDFYGEEIFMPSQRLRIVDNNSTCLKLIDSACPILAGQRGVINVPKNTVKVDFLKELTNSLSCLDGVTPVYLLVDQRPEDIAVMKSTITHGELLYTVFDRRPSDHLRMTENALNRAKSLALSGENVVLVIDSLQKLAKAYYTEELVLRGNSFDSLPSAVYKIKQVLSCARAFNNGSVTVLTISEIGNDEKESRAIYEEVKYISNLIIDFDEKPFRPSALSVNLNESYSENCEKTFVGEEVLIYNFIKEIVSKDVGGSVEVNKAFYKHAFDNMLLERLKEIRLLQEDCR